MSQYQQDADTALVDDLVSAQAEMQQAVLALESAARHRASAMQALADDGATLRRIGEVLGISHTAVWAAIHRHAAAS